ncbi:MAG: hypothetical protein ACXAC5_02435 [Promethearchaeota archaeon]|jgi:hypothetical protein
MPWWGWILAAGGLSGFGLLTHYVGFKSAAGLLAAIAAAMETAVNLDDDD